MTRSTAARSQGSLRERRVCVRGRTRPSSSGRWHGRSESRPPCSATFHRCTATTPKTLGVLAGLPGQPAGARGSCRSTCWSSTMEVVSEVQHYLLDQQRQGAIQFLLLSERNLGKGGAWNVIFQAAPGEILAYTDCDALFYRGLADQFAAHPGDVSQAWAWSPAARSARLPSSYTRTLAWAETDRERQRRAGDVHPVGDLPRVRHEPRPGRGRRSGSATSRRRTSG